MRPLFALLLLISLLTNFALAQDYDKKTPLSNGYFQVSKGGKIGYLNDKGKEITGIIYDKGTDFSANGFANVFLGKLVGTINKEGKEIVPVQFLEVWHGAKINLFITMNSDSMRGVYNEKGKEIVKSIYNFIASFNAQGISYYRKGKEYGIIDKSGTTSGNTFTKIYSEKGGFFLYETSFSRGKMYDYIDSTGKVYTNFYDDAFDFGPYGTAVVVKGKKYGYINSKMEMVIPYEYEHALTFNKDTTEVVKNGIPGKLTRENKFIPVEKITWGKKYKADETFGYRATNIGSLWGFVDKNQKMIIPFVYEDVYSFGKGGFAAAKKNGSWGVIDRKNNVILDFSYNDIGGMGDSTCWVKEGMGYSIINVYTKKDIVKSAFIIKNITDFKDGVYYVTTSDGGKATVTSGGVAVSEADLEKKKAEELLAKWQATEKTRTIPWVKSTPGFLTASSSLVGMSIPKNRVGHKANYPYGARDIIAGKSAVISIGGHHKNSWIDEDSLKTFWIGRQKPFEYYSKMEFHNYNGGGPSMLKKGIENDDEDIVACSSSGLRYFKKTGNTYEFKRAQNLDYFLLDLIDLKNDKIAAIAADGYDQNERYERLYLIIWEYKKNELSTYLISGNKTTDRSRLINTADGHVLIASSESDLLTLEKIDINKTILNKKVVAIWKKKYPEPGDNIFSDIIEDRNGNFVAALRGFPKTAYFTDKNKTKYEHATVAIAKISADGNSFGWNKVTEVGQESWGRSKGGKLTMRDQDKIRFSPFSFPRIIQNPEGPGYLLQTRYSYGLWKYQSEDGSNGTDDGRTLMYADQPCILLFNEKSLAFNSTDFVETTFNIQSGVSPNSYNYKEQLGKYRRANDFLWVPQENKFLLLDNSGYSTNYFYISIEFEDNWAGEASSVSDVPLATNNNVKNTGNSSSTTKNSTTQNTTQQTGDKFEGMVYFRFDFEDKRTKTNEYMYFHYGSNAAYKTSSRRGNYAAIKCEKTKVYYSLTGEKKDAVFLREITPEDCGKSFKSSEF